MKTIAFILLLFIAGSSISYAQCNKHLLLVSSKTDHLDAGGNIQRTVDETAKIEISKPDLTITINDDHKITGTILSDSCAWTVPFKDGKTVIKATVSEQGEQKNVTLTIEGKDGKVTVLFEMEGMPDDRIKVGIDKFEEKS